MYKELLDNENVIKVKIEKVRQWDWDGKNHTPLPHKYKVSVTVEYKREWAPGQFTYARKAFSNTADAPFQASSDLYNKLVKKGIINATL